MRFLKGKEDMIMTKNKKTLQERMESMRPYFKGIEMYNEALIVILPREEI